MKRKQSLAANTGRKIVLAKATPHKSAEQFRELRHPHLINFQQEWLDYDGSAYQLIKDETIEAEVGAFLVDSEIMQIEEVGGRRKKVRAPFNPKNADVREVVDALARLCHRPEGTVSPPSWLDGRSDPDPRNVISCSNCLVDIITGNTYERTPQYFTRTALPLEYNELAPDPTRWGQFLAEVTDNSEPLTELLQEMAGYLIASDTTQQRVFFPIGPPRSGKGTFLRTLNGLIGQNNIHNPTIQSLAGQFGLHPLVGKSVAIIGDATCHDRQKLSTAANRINGISGEDPQGVERKFKDPINVRLPTRIVVASNHLPDFGDHSAAIAARLIFLPFSVSFEGREDRRLEGKLTAELPGILNWALAGLARLNARGYFVEPEECLHIKRRMLYLSNPVRGFIDECCALEANAVIDKKILHEQYRVYCEEMGARPVARDTFSEKLFELVPSTGKSKAPRSQSRAPIYTGIRLNDTLLREAFEPDPLAELLGTSGIAALKLDKDGKPIPRHHMN